MMMLVHPPKEHWNVEHSMQPVHPSITEQNKQGVLQDLVCETGFTERINLRVSVNLAEKYRHSEDGEPE